MEIQNHLTSLYEETLAYRQSYYPQQVQSITALCSSIFETITTDGKIFVYGQGTASIIADVIMAYGIGCYQTDRLPLPFFSLQSNATMAHTALLQYGSEQTIQRHFQSLAISNDALLIFDMGTDSHMLTELVASAHEKEVKVFCCTSAIDHSLSSVLQPVNDVAILLPNLPLPKLLEEYLFLSHQILDTLDALLIGDL